MRRWGTSPQVDDATGDNEAAQPLSKDVTASIDEAQESLLCPEDETLPAVVAKPYAKTHLEVLERDGWRCQYPGCTVRAGLHVHHIEYRVRFGAKEASARGTTRRIS